MLIFKIIDATIGHFERNRRGFRDRRLKTYNMLVGGGGKERKKGVGMYTDVCMMGATDLSLFLMVQKASEVRGGKWGYNPPTPHFRYKDTVNSNHCTLQQYSY